MIYRLRFVFLGVLFLSIGAFVFFTRSKESPPSYPVTEQKAFVIVIPSYNNAKYIEKNLQSVFSQEYDNYRVIYINDHSRDETLPKAKQLLAQFDKDHRTTLFHNSTNLGALANKYHAAHLCRNHEILVFLDGDDYFAHENVLTTLNEAYANPNVWLTYGNSLDYPSFHSSPKEKPHLCTCYAALFKEIKIEDLFYRGHFYLMGSHHAILRPLLEMTPAHSTYIEEILYLKNRKNPLSNEKINSTFQQECIDHIHSRHPYSPLSALPQRLPPSQSADLLIFSEDNPLQLLALLESIEEHVMGLNKTTILYKTSSPEFESGYLELKLDFPKLHFIAYAKDFKSLCTKIILEKTLPNIPYILFAHDTVVIKEPIDLSDSIALLEKTHAYGFYFSHHEELSYCSQLDRYQPLPPYAPIAINSDALAWQFSAGMDDWNSPNNLNFTLYKKDNLKNIFTHADYNSLDTLIEEWTQQAPQEKIGLFFPKASCFSITTQQPPLSLLEKFHAGLKIELPPLYHANCPSQEASATISFIPRD